MVAGQQGGGLGPGIAARQGQDADHSGMVHELAVEVRPLRQRHFEDDRLVVSELVQLGEDCRLELVLHLGLAGAADIHLGLDDGHQPGNEDLTGEPELLLHDGAHPVPGQLDDRAHLRPEHVLFDGSRQ
ncbi:Uncharacterised protein [Streptococcus pneumoniae]|nr:Uncharacterised protein [Streptococcus pneumoniae]